MILQHFLWLYSIWQYKYTTTYSVDLLLLDLSFLDFIRFAYNSILINTHANKPKAFFFFMTLLG